METGRSRGTHRGVGAAGGDFRADILALEEVVREAGERCKTTFIAGKNLVEHQAQFQGWEVALGEDRAVCRLDAALQDRFVQLGIPTETEWIKGGMGSELRGQVEAIKRWYCNDWIVLANKLRSQ